MFRVEYDTSSAVVPPIVLASTFNLPSADFLLASGTKTPVYGRYGNLTRNQLEATLAKLEGARETIAFSSGNNAVMPVLNSIMFFTCNVMSGMAAANATVEALLKQGDHIVASKQVLMAHFGILT